MLVRKEKFNFPHKAVDPTKKGSVRAALQKEPFYSHENSILLTDYFTVLRDFVQAMVQEESDLILAGSNSYIAYGKPEPGKVRIPSDADFQIGKNHHPEQILELIKDIISREKDAKFSLHDAEISSKSSLRARIDAELHGITGSCKIDVVAAEDIGTVKKKMNKIITTDEIFDVTVPEIEASVAGKIESILNRISFAHRNVNFRMKDFYDVYMLCHNNEINRKLVNEYLSYKIERNDRCTDTFKHTQDNLDAIVEVSKKEQWDRFKRQNKVSPDINVDSVVGFGKSLIQDMEI